jgi:hypothetical protein
VFALHQSLMRLSERMTTDFFLWRGQMQKAGSGDVQSDAHKLYEASGKFARAELSGIFTSASSLWLQQI